MIELPLAKIASLGSIFVELQHFVMVNSRNVMVNDWDCKILLHSVAVGSPSVYSVTEDAPKKRTIFARNVDQV
jgi:hypothetical protein